MCVCVLVLVYLCVREMEVLVRVHLYPCVCDGKARSCMFVCEGDLGNVCIGSAIDASIHVSFSFLLLSVGV